MVTVAIFRFCRHPCELPVDGITVKRAGDGMVAINPRFGSVRLLFLDAFQG